MERDIERCSGGTGTANHVNMSLVHLDPLHHGKRMLITPPLSGGEFGATLLNIVVAASGYVEAHARDHLGRIVEQRRHAAGDERFNVAGRYAAPACSSLMVEPGLT